MDAGLAPEPCRHHLIQATKPCAAAGAINSAHVSDGETEARSNLRAMPHTGARTLKVPVGFQKQRRSHHQYTVGCLCPAPVNTGTAAKFFSPPPLPLRRPRPPHLSTVLPRGQGRACAGTGRFHSHGRACCRKGRRPQTPQPGHLLPNPTGQMPQTLARKHALVLVILNTLRKTSRQLPRVFTTVCLLSSPTQRGCKGFVASHFSEVSICSEGNRGRRSRGEGLRVRPLLPVAGPSPPCPGFTLTVSFPTTGRGGPSLPL